jgi:flagellar motor switch protein FliM
MTESGTVLLVIPQVILEKVHELLVDRQREDAKSERTHLRDGLFDQTVFTGTRFNKNLPALSQAFLSSPLPTWRC